MKDKIYVSTRNSRNGVGFRGRHPGLAPDGGLYVPTFIDDVRFDLNALKDLSYPELAKAVLSEFLDFTPEQIDACIEGARYQSGRFDIDSLVRTVPTSFGESLSSITVPPPRSRTWR